MIEDEYTTPDGQVTTWLGTKAPVHDAQGNIRYIVTVGIDISERKRAEEALRANQRLLRALIDAVPASIVVKDAEDRYVLVNTFHEAFHNRPSEWFMGKTVMETFGGDYARRVMEKDRRLIESGETATTSRWARAISPNACAMVCRGVPQGPGEFAPRATTMLPRRGNCGVTLSHLCSMQPLVHLVRY